MNCECFYIVKGGTIEDARRLAGRINDVAEMRGMELYAVCISKVKQELCATSDYDNMGRPFNVPEGSWLVFVQGKYHYMFKIRPRGGKRGFPMESDFYECFEKYVDDIEACWMLGNYRR